MILLAFWPTKLSHFFIMQRFYDVIHCFWNICIILSPQERLFFHKTAQKNRETVPASLLPENS